jgi:hypothetical protein
MKKLLTIRFSALRLVPGELVGNISLTPTLPLKKRVGGYHAHPWRQSRSLKAGSCAFGAGSNDMHARFSCNSSYGNNAQAPSRLQWDVMWIVVLRYSGTNENISPEDLMER